ncbi:MAG: rRNA maturation RNase YbeY [Candidatus Rokubacteria bacterium]|nr:rRNA maturation RNase YbeY [Candidatus Rokubacteria bacterium]
MAVALVSLQRGVRIPRARVCRLAESALRALGRTGAEVHLTFVNDARIARLNGQYRGVRRATDVLAFPLEAPGFGRLLGEIVVSAETARRHARRLRVPVGLELELLVVHGLLHLVGYDDRDSLEARLMHERERAILKRASRPIPGRLWTGLLTAP